eukprot:364533-Chlamydomonas_euryale.AAC.6
MQQQVQLLPAWTCAAAACLDVCSCCLLGRVQLLPAWTRAAAAWLDACSCCLVGRVQLLPGWTCAAAAWLDACSCCLLGRVQLLPGWMCAAAAWLDVCSCCLVGRVQLPPGWTCAEDAGAVTRLFCRATIICRVVSEVVWCKVAVKRRLAQSPGCRLQHARQVWTVCERGVHRRRRGCWVREGVPVDGCARRHVGGRDGMCVCGKAAMMWHRRRDGMCVWQGCDDVA